MNATDFRVAGGSRFVFLDQTGAAGKPSKSGLELGVFLRALILPHRAPFLGRLALRSQTKMWDVV